MTALVYIYNITVLVTCQAFLTILVYNILKIIL